MQIVNEMIARLFRILIMWVTLLPGLQAAQQPREWTEAHLDELLSYYREFHSQPELSFRELGTAARLAAAWEKCGYQVTTGVGGNGVVGLLHNGSGPVVMLRAGFISTESSRLGISIPMRPGVTRFHEKLADKRKGQGSPAQ